MQKTLPRTVLGATLVSAAVAVAFAGVSLHHRTARGLPAVGASPDTLGETGLFAGQASGQVMSFTPQYPLWSDGATKRRWLYLPPGTSIDASNPDAWQFPVGTRVWKEFTFHGVRVETRFMQRLADGWHYATYAWSADGRDAVRAPARGATSIEIAPGVHHQIPGEADCRACHASGPTPVLGFSALQLSDARDPGALHRETPAPGSVTLSQLAARGLVTGLPPELLADPPRIPGPPVERTALGYLHANCGGCHRSDGPLASVGMELAFSLRAPGGAQRTTVAVPSHFSAPGVRIAPGAHDASVLYARISSRTPLEQMPPLGTQLVDTEATRLIARWIDQLAPDPKPTDAEDKSR